MIRKLSVFAALIALMPTSYGLARGPKAQTNFSGRWVLDMAQTHNVPSRLQSFKMNVRQSAKYLTVNSKVKGDFQRSFRREGTEGDDGSSPGSRPQGGGYPGGGYPGRAGGYPGGGGYPGIGRFPGGRFPGGGFPGGHRGGFPGGHAERMRKFMAFSMINPKETYALDGTASSMKVDRPIPGTALLKAAWKKGGKQLDLSRVESLRGGERTIKVREQWKLLKGGSVLQVERTVDTPRGSAKAKMIFDRLESPAGNTK